MDLSTVDPAVIQARGEYATVNSEYKRLMSLAQQYTQQACDSLRHVLQSEGTVGGLNVGLKEVENLTSVLKTVYTDVAEAKAQKDVLYHIAWGK